MPDLGGGWVTDDGTSFAAPHVAGALILAHDYGTWHPAILKAWLINAAEDKGASGWDSSWGWGYIDLAEVYANRSYKLSGYISQYSNKWYSGTMDAGEKVTIVWLKHPGTSLTDLDLYLYDSDGDLLDKSELTRDNVEQVELGSGSDVSVYVRVHSWYVSGSEHYAFASESYFEGTSAPPWWSPAPPRLPLVDRETPQSQKKVFALYRNYPNPFNPETWIPYQLASEADVVIRIYNSSGQLIRTLSLGNQPEGIYAAEDRAAHWDGRNEAGEQVSSGIYFYTQ